MIRPVDEAGPHSPIADDIRRMAEQAIAQGAVVFLGAWETETDPMTYGCTPRSAVLRAGFVKAIHRVEFEGVEE